MAKKLISDYTFVPYDNVTLTGGTVSIKDNISGERILLITNVTDNEIYTTSQILQKDSKLLLTRQVVITMRILRRQLLHLLLIPAR